MLTSAPTGAHKELRVSLDEKVDASAQPFEIGTRGHAGECRRVELARCGFCECDGRLLRPLDAAGARDDLLEPQHLARQAALARPRQEVSDPCPVRCIGVAERVREQKGAFAFQQIAVDLLAVSRNVSVEVQDVVGDLERSAKQIAEAIEPIEIAGRRRWRRARRSASGE